MRRRKSGCEQCRRERASKLAEHEAKFGAKVSSLVVSGINVNLIRNTVETPPSKPLGYDVLQNDEPPTMDRKVVAGACAPGICGNEAACISGENSTHYCVCPHDSSSPTADLKCPNRIIVSEIPQPIHNIIPPTSNFTSNVATNTTAIETSPELVRIDDVWTNRTDVLRINDASASVLVPLVGVAVFLSIFIAIVCAVTRRAGVCGTLHKTRAPSAVSKNPSPSPVLNLNKSILPSDRYVSNPQYSSCTTDDHLAMNVLNRSHIQFVQEIGEGCFGKVFKGELQLTDDEDEPTSQVVAIKVLKQTANVATEEDFLREVHIMSTFKHANILTLIGVVLREGDLSPWMVFEYMPHGDLAEVLRANSKSPLWHGKASADLPMELTTQVLLDIAFQIASGMRYLAKQRFVHRDLACRNCLVGSDHNQLVVKIADFGMSRDVYTCDYYKIGGSRLLPVRWMSPESVTYGRFTLESDIWSYGVVLWEIFSLGKQPYYGHSNDQVLKLILQGIMLIPPETSPPDVCHLMGCCWKTEPRDRIQFWEICERLEAIMLKLASPLVTDVKRDFVIDRMDAFNEEEFKRGRFGAGLDMLDSDGYLMPQIVKPKEYLTTFSIGV